MNLSICPACEWVQPTGDKNLARKWRTHEWNFEFLFSFFTRRFSDVFARYFVVVCCFLNRCALGYKVLAFYFDALFDFAFHSVFLKLFVYHAFFSFLQFCCFFYVNKKATVTVGEYICICYICVSNYLRMKIIEN